MVGHGVQTRARTTNIGAEVWSNEGVLTLVGDILSSGVEARADYLSAMGFVFGYSIFD
jgi:hypothetical protein